MTGRHARLLVLLGAALTASAPLAAQPVEGYVDLHSHLAGELAFGGSWFWGTVEGPMDWAVRRCDGNFLTKSHASGRLPIVAELLGADTGWHLGRRRGYDRRECQYFLGIKIPGTCPRPHFEHWPKWDTIAHQQMWSGWLRQAQRGGLRIMLVSLVESRFLCLNTGRQRFDCDEMASVERQLTYVQEFAARNSDWVGIARSPAEARALVRDGKLALVLSVEVTDLFPTGDVVAQVEALRKRGVRSLQIAHHANNRFAGAAPIPKLVKAAKQVETLWSLLAGYPIDITDIDEVTCRDEAGRQGDCDGSTYLNERGLTSDGGLLVRAMMDRGMLVDVAHLSRRAFGDVYDLANERDHYPLLYSHAHMWDTISPSEERHEKYIQAEEIYRITDTGGMVGLRTGPEATTDYSVSVRNTCSGSSRSFAQSLMYAVDQGLDVGFGIDMNGFIEQIKPRARSPECRDDLLQIAGSGHVDDFDKKGLAHIGLLPALMADLEELGVPASYLDHLNRSAETFLQMWERAETRSGEPSLARQAVASASSVLCSGAGPHCDSPAESTTATATPPWAASRRTDRGPVGVDRRRAACWKACIPPTVSVDLR